MMDIHQYTSISNTKDAVEMQAGLLAHLQGHKLGQVLQTTARRSHAKISMLQIARDVQVTTQGFSVCYGAEAQRRSLPLESW
jgi:hypothetical protein